MAERLLLKWGGLKGYEVETEASKSALDRFYADPVCWSAALHENTPAQKQALLDLIDVINGPITNDWTGKEMSKEDAKKYVLEYGR